MKNIIKTLMVVISSVALSSFAYAGELSVTGTAKATYNIGSGSSTGNALGVNNHIDFTGTGETDFGAFTYSIQMEPSGATQTVADQSLTLATAYGTIGVFVSEGGLDLEDGGSRGVYARATDSGGPDNPVDNGDISSYNNMQYHTPAGLLPFGTVFKVAYSGNTYDTAINDSNAAGTARAPSTTTFGTLTAYQITAAPIEGLSIGASYMDPGEQGISGTKVNQKAEWGAAYAKYDIGAIGLGYSKSLNAPINSFGVAQTIEYYEANNYSVSFNVNENLSVSYEKEKNERIGADATADASQTTDAIQAAYTAGGLTLAVSHGETKNVSYGTSTQGNTLIAVSMAF
jgi:outer membrane protein OmpU